MNNQPAGKRNIWNLVLGLAFLLYGSYRIYHYTMAIEKDTFRLILAIGFVIFGIYDLYKYFKGYR